MSKRKYTMARLNSGRGYNYRAYCFFRAQDGGWFMLGEDEETITFATDTIKKVRRHIDGLWRRAERQVDVFVKNGLMGNKRPWRIIPRR